MRQHFWWFLAVFSLRMAGMTIWELTVKILTLLFDLATPPSLSTFQLILRHCILGAVRAVAPCVSVRDWLELYVNSWTWQQAMSAATARTAACRRSTAWRQSNVFHRQIHTLGRPGDRCNFWPTRMWANAQRHGRPAEHRWRPLFNAAKFVWRPLLDCRAVTLPRRESRWN